MDDILPLNGLLLGFLLDRSGVIVDLRMVLNHLPWDPRNPWPLPGKHVYIGPEEGDECEFLFTIQIPRDVGPLGNIRPDLDDLNWNVLAARGLHVGC
jgi:hypothetical protein